MAQVGIEMKSASVNQNDRMENRNCMTSVAASKKRKNIGSRVVEMAVLTVVIVFVWGVLSLPAIFNYVELPQSQVTYF